MIIVTPPKFNGCGCFTWSHDGNPKTKLLFKQGERIFRWTRYVYKDHWKGERIKIMIPDGIVGFGVLTIIEFGIWFINTIHKNLTKIGLTQIFFLSTPLKINMDHTKSPNLKRKIIWTKPPFWDSMLLSNFPGCKPPFYGRSYEAPTDTHFIVLLDVYAPAN